MPSSLIRTRTFPRAPAVAVVCCLALPLVAAAAGCGKKGPPLPPVRLAPTRVAKVGVKQVGGRILLSFPRPGSRTDETTLGPDAEIEISMTAREPVPARAEEIVAHPAVVWSIPASEWPAYAAEGRLDVGLSMERLREGLELPAEAPGLTGRHLSFVVVVTEPKNRRSEPSDIATFVVCGIPRPRRSTPARAWWRRGFCCDGSRAPG